MQRRMFMTTVGTVGLVGLAGCSGLTGDLDYTAAPATLDTSAVDVEYTTEGPTKLNLSETFEIAGESRTVEATTWTTTYMGDAGPVVVASTPNVTVLGQSANPLARLSGGELISRLLEELGGTGGMSINDLEAVGETPVTVLGTEATIQEFTGTIEASSVGQSAGNQLSSDGSGSAAVRIYLLSVTHSYGSDGSDVILTFAIQPQSDTDRETITQLFGSLQHPVEPPASASESN